MSNNIIDKYLEYLQNEGCGMISKIPSCGEMEDTEEGSTEDSGTKLPWSNT